MISRQCITPATPKTHSIRSILCMIALAFAMLASPAQALVYEWNLERNSSFYSDTFIEKQIFEKTLDGEIDIYIEQTNNFTLDLSEISINYLDGTSITINSSVINTGTENSKTCNETTLTGCIQDLGPDHIKFQHFIIPLNKDPLNLGTDAILSAQLSLIGSGLDFNDPDLRVRWDWSDHLGTAHNVSTVAEPSTLMVFSLGFLIFAFGRRCIPLRRLR